MRQSLKRIDVLHGAAAVTVAAAALLSTSSPHLLVAAGSGIRGEGVMVTPQRILADCTSELGEYSGCMDTNGLQSCDSTCVAPAFEEAKNFFMNMMLLPGVGGFISCAGGENKICWTMEECDCVRPCYEEAMDLLLCQNDAQKCADELHCSPNASGSSSGGEGEGNAAGDDYSSYNGDDLTARDDAPGNEGDDGTNGASDDLTTTDDYYYDDYDGESSSGAGSNGCSSQLSSYNQCLVDNDIESCDTCAGAAYNVIANQLSSNLITTGSFGTCDSVASYVCAVFEQCECLRPCLAETAAYAECDTQESVGCDIRCASASSFSSSRGGSDSVVSPSGTAGGGLANQTKVITAAEAAGRTSDAARVAARARKSLLITFGTVAWIGFGLVA